MTSVSYMWEVFYTGARGLASGTGRIPGAPGEDISGLYPLLRLMGPNMDLPSDSAAKAQDLMRRVSCKAAKGNEGTIAATCRAMDDEEARRSRKSCSTCSTTSASWNCAR